MPSAKTKTESPATFSNAALAWLFFFSGVLALVYEVLWQRRFALVFGSAAPATAAVLAAYFAGLALGSYIIGNRSHRFQSPLKLYAFLEIGIALGAILVEVWLHLFDRFHPSIATSAAALLAIKTLLAIVALALPTLCMGGTLPAFGALIDRIESLRRKRRNESPGEHHLGITAGLLYVVNTTGAALGVLIVPLALLPYLGPRNSLLVCIAGNLLIAALAWRLSKNEAEGRARSPERAAPKTESSSNPQHSSPSKSADQSPLSPRERAGVKGPLLPSMALAFISGFVAFVAQVLWNRAFAQVHENSLYSFALIAAVFIAALAFGGQITRLALARNFKPDSLIAFSWIVGGLLLIVSPWIFLRATSNLSYIGAPNGWFQYAARLTQLAFIIVLPIATLMGIALPAIFERAGRIFQNSGKALGQLLTANLIGATAGSLVAGFLFPKLFGLWGAMIVVGALLVLPTANLLPKFRVLFLFSIPVIFALTRIDLPRARLATDQGEKLVAVSEGAHGIVAVTDRANSRRLKLNNAYVLGGTVSTGDERMQSHIPLLLHPKPERVAYMGLGTGITAGGALLHPVKQVTLLELVPEVAQAARAHFADANLRLLDQPQSHLIVEDARNFLRHTDEKFDVIIGDLVVPWRAGEGALFTIENFQSVKNALAPGGLFCQWLPLFQLSEDEFQILLNTFQKVFPRVLFWRGDFSPTEPALGLVGFSGDSAPGSKLPHFSPETIRARFNEMKRDPANPQLISEFAIWMHFLGALNHPLDLTVKINSEDRPWIELMGPLNHAGKGGENLFIGRRFQKWSAELRREASLAPLLGEKELAAIEAGAALNEFTLSYSEGNQAAATQAQFTIQRLAPAPLIQILFPQEMADPRR